VHVRIRAERLEQLEMAKLQAGHQLSVVGGHVPQGCRNGIAEPENIIVGAIAGAPAGGYRRMPDPSGNRPPVPLRTTHGGDHA